MSTLVLKIIASVSMLIDHIGFHYGITAFRVIGRLAFPIYLFLIYNGYSHSSNPFRYALRLGIFAVISQIPFSLGFYDVFWHSTGNVMFTLLVCLLTLIAADALSKHKWLKWGCLVPFLGAFFIYYKHIIWSEYGDKAILMTMVLFLFGQGKSLWKGVTAAGLAVAMNYGHILAIAKNVLGGTDPILPVLGEFEVIQLAALLAIPLILLYNGKKGTMPGSPLAVKVLQYGFYLFYPAHMLILWLITLL
jgi:hypothetical protein